MRKFVTLTLAAAAISAAAAPAFAQDARWSDVRYLSAQRCLGLSQAEGLGPIDASSLEVQIKSQASNRHSVIIDRGDATRRDAVKAGRAPSEKLKAKLLAERDACAAYSKPQVAAN